MRIFKSKYFWLTLGFLLLIGLVLGLGVLFEWSMTARLIGVIAVLAIAVLVLAIGFVRAARSSNLIEQSIKAQAQQQLVNTRPDRRPEIEELQRQLESAIERLKQSKLGRGRSGRAALYAMPWYLFIGPPGAGKTTAILNSGLNFPLGTDRIRGVGGTRNCDWFFTDQAILLDTAGRYVTEDEDSEEWHAFLDTLKKHRKERPINGAIVGISISELSQLTTEEIEWHAATIRQRIDELVARLGVRFPVFLVFTKCDLLQGFVEFFGDLSRKDREQIWGCSLDRDEIEKQDASVVFEAEYQRLYESLLSMRSTRLNRSMKRQDRQKVYVFPLEFAAAQEKLSIFVARLFQPNPYQESPVFRGFYFSSGTQEGAPIDHVIQSIARQFDLTPERAWQQPVMETEEKSYFIKDLFTDVIVPDQYMVRQTTRRVLQGHLARAGVGMVAVLLLALWIIGLSQAVFRSQSQLSRVGEAAMMVAPVRWQSPDGVENELESMETLLEQIERIEADLHRFRPLQMGLDRSVAVLEPARRLYLDRARTFVQMQSFQEIQSRLDAAVRMRGTERTNRDALHDDFRAYLLMTRERARLQEEADRMFLARHLTGAGAASGANRQERINRQLRAYVDGLARGHIEPFADDEFLISRVRSLIYEPPSIERTYRRIREEGEAALGAVTLADVLQGRYLDMFSTRPEVPAVFTKRGWATFVEEAIDNAVAGTGQLDYVMGYSDADRPEQMQDGDRLKEQLRQAYFTDYATMWERFLRSVRLARVNDLRSGVRQLTELSSPYESPLLYVLAQVSHQTRFEEEGLVDGLAGRAADVAARRAERSASRVIGQSAGIERDQNRAPVHPVDRRFARLHELAADRAESGDAAPGLQRAIQSLGAVAGALEELQGNPALAAGFAERVFAQNGAELAMHLQTINSNLPNLEPDVRSALFIDPVIGAWEAILAETQRLLNDRWIAEVYEPCRALAGRYPLDLNSAADAPLDQFEKFFDPENGAIDAFFKETLVRYLTPDRRQGRSWNGRGISVSPAVFEAARASSRIGEALFSGGVLRTEFQIQAEVPVYADDAPRASLVEIDVHGRSDSYDMGGYRPWSDFAWPGRSGARIRAETRNGPFTRDFSGDWAFFRMLQDAQIQRVSQTEYDLRWPLEGGLTVRYQLRTRSSNNPFGDIRGFFRLECPATL